jgi:uncharacterized protein (TIGR01244 family)
MPPAEWISRIRNYGSSGAAHADGAWRLRACSETAGGETMSDFRRLSDKVLASPQLTLDDVAFAQRAGVKMIVNNRPEGEAPDQTPGAEIEAAARAAGIDYRFIPVSPGVFNESQVREMVDSLGSAKGTILAYCRTGTRSTLLWALAQAALGTEPEIIAAAAAAAGYDVSPIRSSLTELAKGAPR